jgi:2-polyprenyl-3-methyl-5-hydroxy-6-metoxy-1,4-benzoquinol methylase
MRACIRLDSRTVTDRPVEDLFMRLDRERRDADRAYNDALSAVDRAIQAPPRVPPAPRPYDDQQVTPINRAWNILPDGAPRIDRSIRGRLRAFIWRIVGPPLDTQKQFNAAVVDHINRNVPGHREVQQTLAAVIDVIRGEFEALVRFESLLVQYLQTITAYVDTKDRTAGAAEIRERLTFLEQRIISVKRELESTGRHAAPPPASGSHNEVFSGRLDSTTYLGFEDRFRGSQDQIRLRVADYGGILAAASDVLDVGCGRGELLDMLRQRGVKARGIDVNHAMVELCRGRGLDAEESDAVGYLERQREAAIGGLVAIQVVEHFEPAYLVRFLELAYDKLRPGAPLVLETVNPACWMAFFETYIRDLTHQRPLHPETLKYLVQAAGFTGVDIQFREPVGEGDRLDRVADVGTAAGAPLASVAAAVNAHADKLNARLFSSMDYAVIARR